MTRPQVAVIGAGGFVASALIRELEARGTVEVRALDRDRFDITRPVEDVLEGSTVVVNAAGVTSRELTELLAVNAIGPTNVAEWCVRARIRMVHLSSGGVFEANVGRVDEETVPLAVSHYGLSKYLGELGVSEASGGSACIVRLFFPYGRGQRLPRLIPRLIQALRSGDPIEINADGGPFIHLGHVEDVARFLVEDFLLAEEPMPVANLASDQVLSVADLTGRLAAALGKKPILTTRSAPIALPDVRPYRPAEWRAFDPDGLLD